MALIRLYALSAPENTFGGGKVLVVVVDEVSTTASWTGWGEVISQSITPSSTSSKILVLFNGVLGPSQRYHAGKLYRDTTQIALGDANGNRTRVWFTLGHNQSATNQDYNSDYASAHYLDSPSTTSAVTYKVEMGSMYVTNLTSYRNRGTLDADYNYYPAGSTSLTLIEIDGSS